MNLMDIAAAAGVSTSTVSRVINGGKNIAPATARTVLRVMRDLGYLAGSTPKKYKKRLSNAGFEHHITAISFDWQSRSNLVAGIDFLNQLSITLANQGIQMTYLYWPRKSLLPSELLEQSEAFILLEGTLPVKLSQQLSGKPVVSLFCPHGVPGDQILTGYYQAGKLAANYFLQNNIRRMILLRPSHQPGFINEMGEGFKLFCKKEENIVFEELRTDPRKTLPNQQGLEQQIEELIRQLVPLKAVPVGIFAPCCHVTALAYRFLQQSGITPGKEIYFVCSNSQISLLVGLHPRPAIIDMGLAEMAQNAANLILLRIQNPTACRPFQISVVPNFVNSEQVLI